MGGFEGRDVGRDANEADARGASLIDILAQYIKYIQNKKANMWAQIMCVAVTVLVSLLGRLLYINVK